MAELWLNLSCAGQFWPKIFLVFDLNDGFIKSKFHFDVGRYHVEQTDLHSSFKFEANQLKIKEVMDNFVLYFVHFWPLCN